jgi:hypothetical protein
MKAESTDIDSDFWLSNIDNTNSNDKSSSRKKSAMNILIADTHNPGDNFPLTIAANMEIFFY